MMMMLPKAGERRQSGFVIIYCCLIMVNVSILLDAITVSR